MIQNDSLSYFLKQIQKDSYSSKYKKWSQYLDKVQSSSSGQQYLTALKTFLQQFPFNYIHWISFIHYNNNSLSSYEIALKRNSKSFQLWSAYLIKLKQECKDADLQSKYKKQIQRAIIQIGADTRAISFYQQYYQMITDNFKYQFFKKIMTRALIGLQDIFETFKNWIALLNQTQVNFFYTKQIKGAISLTNQLTLQKKKAFLYEQIQKTYKKTIKYRQERIDIQDRIQRYYFDGSQQQKQQLQNWRQLFQLQRKYGVIQNISYCYQRSLMSQTQNYDLWNQVFHYLEHETNKYAKVLSMLRNNKTFFIKFPNKQLYFYWCDMQQRQSNIKARQMYNQICKISPTLTTYQRFIQFQIRQKNYNNAKQLYDTMLAMYARDYQTLAYVLIQYSHFVVKYYKDYQYPKQLLKNYFDYLSYNSYLLTEYLKFMQYFQNNQGYYDQLMVILCEAVKKAKKSLRQKQFNEAIKMIRYYLRSVLGSIYLIKLSERRILEVAENTQIVKQNQFVQEEINNKQFNNHQYQ